MVDVHAVVRAFLLADVTLAALVGSRVYAGRDVPPPGYKPDDGAAITFRTRGGGPDYDDAMVNASLQFKCYGASELAAWTCYRTLYDALHNGHNDSLAHARCEILGTLLEEPETEWMFVLGFFQVVVRDP